MQIKKNKKEFINCNLAGFDHTEGYLVRDQMKPGDELIMVREDENKYDKEAVALFYVPKKELPEDTLTHTVKIKETVDNKVIEKEVEALHVGYIAAHFNTQLANFLDFGYKDIFECVITSVDKEKHPNQQVQVRVNLLKNNDVECPEEVDK